MRLHQIAAALFVTLLSLPALALSLGVPQGSAWIGQPLDLRVPLTLDGADGTGSLCAQVDVRQGDAPSADTRFDVRAVLEPGATADRPYLRVRSSRAVEEPVLNLRVKVGCQGVSSREFVLLADPLPVLAAAPAPRPAAVPAPAQPPASARASAPETRSAPRSSRAADASASAAPIASSASSAPPASSAPSEPPARPARPARATRSAERPPQAAAVARSPTRRTADTRRPATAAAKSAEPTRGRLQLDALEPLPQPPLRVARWGDAGAPGSTLRVPAAGGGATEAGASVFPVAPALPAASADPERAAALGASASPTLADVERTTQLEAALAELRAQASQNRQTQVELRGELAQARDNRYRNPLVYVLGLLLVLLAVALWALWRAGRRVPESPWMDAVPREGPIRRRLTQRRTRAKADAQALAQAQADEEDTSHGPMYFPAAVSRRGQLSASDDDDDDDVSSAPDAAHHGPSAREGGEAASARPALPRALDVDELYDVQQQAEFFTSLGQHEQAIDALRHYVTEHPQASALAYLELLNLYHQTQREADYEQLRQQCQQGLNVHLPGFHEFGAVGGRTLEHYPEARARLENYWPRAETLEVIEDMLFRRGDADAAEAFDLAAYRELLMLYALVQEQQFAEDQVGPSLDDLLRLPRLDSAGRVTSNAPSPQARTAPGEASLSAAGGAVNDPFDRALDPQRGDFQSTWPPSLDSELDMDLARLEAQQIDTIPLALRRVPDAPDTIPPTMPLEMPSAVLGELTLEPMEAPAAPGGDAATPEAPAAGADDPAAGPDQDAPHSAQPFRASARR